MMQLHRIVGRKGGVQEARFLFNIDYAFMNANRAYSSLADATQQPLKKHLAW